MKRPTRMRDRPAWQQYLYGACLVGPVMAATTLVGISAAQTWDTTQESAPPPAEPAPSPEEQSAAMWHESYRADGWLPMSEHKAGQVPTYILAMDQFGKVAPLAFDAAWAVNQNDTSHDDVWFIAYSLGDPA